MLATHVSSDSRVKVNPIAYTTASWIWDFIRMNPPILYGSKVEEKPEGFIDEMFNVLDSMCVY